MSMELYHGSPNKFTEFDYGRIRMNGTTEGVGFYFTDNKKIAEGYTNGGYLYTVDFKGKKALSSHKKTITKKELEKVIGAIEKEIGYLDNYGDVGYEGYARLMKMAVENNYTNNESDADIMGSIYMACGDDEGVIELFYKVLGYDHLVATPDWGDQKLYIALTNDIIKIKKVEKL